MPEVFDRAIDVLVGRLRRKIEDEPTVAEPRILNMFKKCLTRLGGHP